jgi:hypothetical protein
METGTAVDAIVSPGRQHFHPSAAKGWVKADTAAGASASYNVSSVTDVGVGDALVYWGTDFSSVHYTAIFSPNTDANLIGVVGNTSFAAGVTRVFLKDTSAAATDPSYYMVLAFGDQ